MGKKIGAIELGGTKIICSVADSDKCLSGLDLDSITRIETRSPSQTLGDVVEYFASQGVIDCLGVGTFGPVDVNVRSKSYGCIQNTPKPGWSGVDLYSFFHSKLSCSVAIDTDVNAAALGEYTFGAGVGTRNMIYITVGTGIGGGIIINGEIVSGLSHPEIGHITIPRDSRDMDFQSVCSFHESCAEGFASGTAISERWGVSLDKLEKTHRAWDMQAFYIAELLHSLVLTVSPEKIIIGGGVASESLLKLVRDKFYIKAADYIKSIPNRDALDSYICLPKLGGKAGSIGAVLLAKKEFC